jgi:hypothetical protein
MQGLAGAHAYKENRICEILHPFTVGLFSAWKILLSAIDACDHSYFHSSTIEDSPNSSAKRDLVSKLFCPVLVWSRLKNVGTRWTTMSGPMVHKNTTVSCSAVVFEAGHSIV